MSCGASNHLCCNMPHKWSSQEATQSKPLIFPRSIIVEQSEVAGWMALSPISSSILAADLSLAMRPSGWTETQSRRVDRAEPGGILQVGCGRGGAAACPDTLGICLAVSRTFGGTAPSTGSNRVHLGNASCSRAMRPPVCASVPHPNGYWPKLDATGGSLPQPSQ